MKKVYCFNERVRMMPAIAPGEGRRDGIIPPILHAAQVQVNTMRMVGGSQDFNGSSGGRGSFYNGHDEGGNGRDVEGAIEVGNVPPPTSVMDAIESSLPPLHPLLIDTVLNHLVPLLRITDLKACRMVCQKWNGVILPRFKTTFTAEISSYLNPQFGVQPKIVEDFVEDMRESREIPFTKYILADFPWKSQTADDFFWLCGQTLTEFTPWLQMNGRQWDLGDLRNLLLYHCPRLEKLYVSPTPQWFRKQKHFFPPTGGDNPREIPTLPSIKEIVINAFRSYPVEFLRDLFGATVNLQKLNLRCQNEEDVKGSGEWPEISVFGAIEWTGRERTLNTLVLVDISDKLLHSLIHLSTNSTLRLKRFTWVYQREDCTVSTALIEGFLKCQQNTLEYLMLDQFTKFDPTSPLHQFNFPVMKNLKMFSYGHETSDALVGPINLAQTFPKLQTLQTGYYSDESYFSSRMNTFEMDRFWQGSSTDTTRISTFHIHKPVLAMDIARMTKIMPLVSRLKIVVYSREALTQIWEGWPNLITLSLSHRCIKDIDCAFTGIPKEEYFRLITENNFQGDATTLAVGPSIRDLKELRSLIIMDGLCSHLSTSVDITMLLSDFTGYHGIKHLTKLREVAIEGSMLTQQCCLKLLDELKLEAWRFTDVHSADLVPPQNIRQIERFFNEFEQERY